MRKRLTPFRRLLTLSAVAAVALLALAGCGGDDEDAKALLSKAFNTPIGSANVTLDLEAKVDGVQQVQAPVKLKLTGPYQTNGNKKLPSFDWDVSVSGGGQAITAGAISTGDNAYIGFQGSNYEIGADRVGQINQQLAQPAPNQGNRSLKDLGIDPQSWVKDAKSEGEEKVAGADTEHVRAGLDVKKMLRDLNGSIDKAGSLGNRVPQQKLTDQQIDQFAEVVKEPKFDLYVGKDDNKLRRISVDLSFDVPEAQRAQFGNAQAGSLSFSLEMAGVGQKQSIQAPADAKPISELRKALGGLGGAGGLPGGGGAAPGGAAPAPGGATPPGGGTSPEKLQQYSECLQKANPGDTAAIQRCAELLR